MVMRDASPTNAQLAPLKDKPIHLVVGKSGYTLGPTTAAIIQRDHPARVRSRRTAFVPAYDTESEVAANGERHAFDGFRQGGDERRPHDARRPPEAEI